MKITILSILLFLPFLTLAQYADIASGWTKEKDRTKIDSKMNELMTRVSFETDCPKEDITYMVIDKYKFFGAKKDHLNFPKTLGVSACGKKLTYILLCIPEPDGNLPKWVDGTWELNSVAE